MSTGSLREMELVPVGTQSGGSPTPVGMHIELDTASGSLREGHPTGGSGAHSQDWE